MTQAVLERERSTALPASWAITTLERICSEIISGAGFPKELQGDKDGKYPFGKVGDISQVFRSKKIKIKSANHYVSDSVREKLGAKVFPAGSIVFPKIGEALKNNYRVINTVPMLFDNNVMGVVPDNQIIKTYYLYYFLLTQDFSGLSRATAVPSIRKSDVSEIKLSCAPQRAKADCLQD